VFARRKIGQPPVLFSDLQDSGLPACLKAPAPPNHPDIQVKYAGSISQGRNDSPLDQNFVPVEFVMA
jgi:hypothetical protein